MDRGVRSGGWAALAVGLSGAARLLVAASVYATAEGAGRVSAFPIPWDITLLALGALTGLAQLVAVQGVRRALGPDTRLLLTVTIVGWIGGLLTILSALYLGDRAVLHAAIAPNVGLWLALLTAFATALWVVGVCAADWRLRRLPAWLRVAGTSFAMLSFTTAILPPLVLLTIPLALVWWFGLGAALLRPRAVTV